MKQSGKLKVVIRGHANSPAVFARAAKWSLPVPVGIATKPGSFTPVPAHANPANRIELEEQLNQALRLRDNARERDLEKLVQIHQAKINELEKALGRQ